MTKEEIYKRAFQYRDEYKADDIANGYGVDDLRHSDIKRAFTDGALWMQEVMTVKACDFLITALNEGLLQTPDIGKLNTMLRKAMEE